MSDNNVRTIYQVILGKLRGGGGTYEEEYTTSVCHLPVGDGDDDE